MKEGALHREWSLWNQLVLRQKNSEDNVGRNFSSFEDEKESDYLMEKENNKLESPYIHYNKNEEILNKVCSLKFILVFSISYLFVKYSLLYISSVNWITPNVPHSTNNDYNNVYNFMHSLEDFQNFNDISPYQNSSVEAHEVIDIPLIPYADISSPIYSQLLLNHTFGSSWNKPAIVKYYPPPSNISYDRIVLTLDITVEGVQYDRMVHVYLGNNEIWRSATIEPSGRLSHSFTQRDVSMYGSLFNKTNDLLVQLDNLVTPKLTGSFEVSLSALYFKDNEDLKNPFGKNLTYPSIVPLTPSKYGVHVPPIVYYPDSKLSLSIPSIAANTTKLLLLLSASGNGAEEFWYSNLLDEYKNSFVSHKHHFYGHGSCRVINVYVDDIRVHSTNPKPYVFSGGIAPPLWNSIVSTGTFDLMPYHIDLTSILPLLWKSSGKLDIEVTNCIDDDDSKPVKSGIGSNWIMSASLAVWEDESIQYSFGGLQYFDNSTAIKSFAINPPFSGMLTQIIKASYNNYFETNVTHVYKDGSKFNKISNFANEVNQTSFTLITKFGDSQSIVSIPKSNSTHTVMDGNSLELLTDLTMLSDSSLSSKLQFLTPSTPDIDDIEYNVTLDIKFGIGSYSGSKKLAEIQSRENGSADFTIAATSGNHGSGSMLHNYSLTRIDGSVYNRVALAENSTVVFDNITETQNSLTELTVDLETPFKSKSTIFSISTLDWLSEEETSELENYLTDDEVYELISALLDVSYSF